ncbi:MAG: DPP IV N-terminal domain-containing protein, partial [Chloroflexota bacterium]
MPKRQRMFGTWNSPISPVMIASGLRLNDVQWTEDGETLVWLEGRGATGTLVAQTGADAARDLTESSMSVRGRVFYGGGEFTSANGVLYFAGTGGRLYHLPLDGGIPTPITPEFGASASPSVSPDGRWLVYVHSAENVDALALVDVKGAIFPRRLVSGYDFFMQPAWHPQGDKIAFIAWNQPNMAWDGTLLQLAHLGTGQDGVPFVESIETIAGTDDVSIFQPEFSPDGRYLAFVSDQTGWWQLYLYDLQSKTQTPLTDAPAEDGAPAWVQGLRTYAWSPDSKAIYFIRNWESRCSLWRCEVANHKLRRVIALDHYGYLGQIAVAQHGEVALLASSS